MPSQLPLVLGPGESVLWEGRPPFPKLFLIAFGLAIFLLVSVTSLAFLSYFSSATATIVDTWVTVLVLLLLSFLRLHRGARFYITSLRIVKTRDFYRWSGTYELPLDSLKDVRSKRAWGKGYLWFIPTPGHNRIHFGPFDADPDRIREIVLRARSSE